MLFKILEKYGKLKTELDNYQKSENEVIEEHDKEIIKNFLELYDNDVKKIHSNEEIVEKNLQNLSLQSVELQNLSEEAIKIYDSLIEYFKEAGDLYNWCTILEKEMENLQEKCLTSENKSEEKKENKNTNS